MMNTKKKTQNNTPRKEYSRPQVNKSKSIYK